MYSRTMHNMHLPFNNNKYYFICKQSVYIFKFEVAVLVYEYILMKGNY